MLKRRSTQRGAAQSAALPGAIQPPRLFRGKIDSITASLTVADGTVGVQAVFNTALRRVQYGKYGKYGNVAFMVTLQGVMESHYTKSNHALR